MEKPKSSEGPLEKAGEILGKGLGFMMLAPIALLLGATALSIRNCIVPPGAR